MLKTRLISAIIAIVVLVLALLSPVKAVFSVALFFITVVGLNEFFNAMKVSSQAFKFIGYIIAVPFMFFYNMPNVFYLSLYLLVLASFSLVILDYSKKNLHDILVTVIGPIFVGFLMSHILKVRDLQFGNLLIWLVFLGAASTDTFAYFFGIRFGKHKITPISPKKSLEGSIAGLLGCMLMTTLFGYFIQIKYGVNYPLYNYIIIGFICGIISQIGDLSASLIKRSVDIKDFGSIMPGHGGVLDRFDSILFIAPSIYYYIYFHMI